MAELFVHEAARDGDFDEVERLVAADPQLINAADAYGCLPLHYAVGYGWEDLVEYLLSKGADATARIPGGATPLHVACIQGRESIVSPLLRAGADVQSA